MIGVRKDLNPVQYTAPYDNKYLEYLGIQATINKTVYTILCRPVARWGSGGSADPPLRTKGPLFGTSRVKLLRPITING